MSSDSFPFFLKKYSVSIVLGVSLAVSCYTLYRYYQSITHTPQKFFQLPKHVNVFIVSAENEVDGAIQQLMDDLNRSDVKVVGLDTEWTSSKKTGNALALLQLSTENSSILLRLSQLKLIPASIVALLENDQIIKSGVAIANDAKLIYTEYGVITRGCVDLQPLAHKYGLTDKGYGLKALAKRVLAIKLNKGHHLRCGNWAAPQLSQLQIEYGAIDAWVGFKIFSEIYHQHAPKDVTITEFCRELTDIAISKCLTSKRLKVDKSDQLMGPQGGLNGNFVPKHLKVPKRQSVLYENCVMLAPDGEALCSINRKKVQWYLDRELADLVQEEPNVIIKLRIDPKGRGHAGSDYYLAKKENRCVACNSDESYVRFSIIPHAYRKFMPLTVKGHSSHDIVLLCQPCHRKASIHSETLRKKLKVENKLVENSTWKIDNELKQVKIAAMTLKKQNKLPEERKRELLDVLKKYFNKEELEEEDYKIASNLTYKIQTESDDNCIEKQIVETLKSEKDLENFIFRWRKHFIDTMKPQFMPIGWKINYPVF